MEKLSVYHVACVLCNIPLKLMIGLTTTMSLHINLMKEDPKIGLVNKFATSNIARIWTSWRHLCWTWS